MSTIRKALHFRTEMTDTNFFELMESISRQKRTEKKTKVDQKFVSERFSLVRIIIMHLTSACAWLAISMRQRVKRYLKINTDILIHFHYKCCMINNPLLLDNCLVSAVFAR